MNKKNNKIFSPVRNQKFLNGVRNDFLSGANGVKNIFRFLPKDYLKFLGRKIMTTVILTVTVMITAGLAIWALAAFTEPVVGPAGSDQDYAQNILGANNADNDFDSSLVTASSTGSIIERQEYVQTQLGTNLDTTVSSRLAAASYVTERGTDSAALASNYTATRAGYLDNLDATVSSRLAAASYVTERGTDSAALASDYTAARATKIDNLDTTISSRALDSEVGGASDAASMSTTLFAGQQYIWDNRASFGGTVTPSMYVTSATFTGAHNCDDTPSTCCVSGYHMCSGMEFIEGARQLENSGTGRKTSVIGTNAWINWASGLYTTAVNAADCSGWIYSGTDYYGGYGTISNAGTASLGNVLCGSYLSIWCCSN